MGKDYYVGVDIGQKHDHSAVITVEKRPPNSVHVVDKQRFPLGTEYSAVIGYLHNLRKNLHDVKEILIDQTGVGEVFVEEARKSGLKNARGLVLTAQSKQEVMVFVKQVIEERRLHMPFDMDLMNEVLAERFEMTKLGLIHYSHPSNTHDDLFWALGLAIYASRPDVPVYHPVFLRGGVSHSVSTAEGIEWFFRRRRPLGPNVPPGEWRKCIICAQRSRPADTVCPKCHGNPDSSTWEPYVPNPWDTEAYLEFLEKHER